VPDPTPAATPTATAVAATPSAAPTVPADYELVEFDVAPGSRPHDVAPAPDGTVWYTGQSNGTLGLLDPVSGTVIAEVDLGQGSAPHGVIVGADGAAWVTDSGRNEIQRVDGGSHEITRYPLPGRNVNLNTAAFDGGGRLWFTGQGGAYGSVDPASGEVDVFEAPRGRGPYGIAATPSGEVWFVSLAGNYLARIESGTGEAEIVDVPTAGQNARRVWSDSTGRLWVSEWDAGQLAMYDPAGGAWREWVLPGPGPRAYSVYVDELDLVWLTDFGSNSIVRFDPATETFLSFPIPSADASVRQMLGRPGEVWGAESGTDKLIVLRPRP
jgi:virginiamycin B lyase